MHLLAYRLYFLKRPLHWKYIRPWNWPTLRPDQLSQQSIFTTTQYANNNVRYNQSQWIPVRSTGSSNAITVLADSWIYSNLSRIRSHGRVNFVQNIRVFDGLRVPIQESDGVISTRPYVHIWKAPCNTPYNGLSCPILQHNGLWARIGDACILFICVHVYYDRRYGDHVWHPHIIYQNLQA